MLILPCNLLWILKGMVDKKNDPRLSTRLSISMATYYICSKSQKKSPEEKASGTKPRPSRCCGICLHALTNHCTGCGKSTEGPEELAVYLGPDGRSRVVGREWSVIAIPGLSSGAGREEPLWTNHHDRAKERLRGKHSLGALGPFELHSENDLHRQQQIPSPTFKLCLVLSLSHFYHQEKNKHTTKPLSKQCGNNSALKLNL